jgi:hypothetical protein
MPYKDPEVRKAKARERYQKNKEEVKQNNKEYYENNKEVRKQQMKQWYYTPNGKKLHTISIWKQRGLIHDDYDALYKQYLEATNCGACKSVFKNSKDRHMDHNHITGLFRQFLCCSCNVQDNWLKHQT